MFQPSVLSSAIMKGEMLAMTAMAISILKLIHTEASRSWIWQDT